MWFRFWRPDYWYFGRSRLVDAGDASPFNRGWSQGFGFFVLCCRWNADRSESSDGIHYPERKFSRVTINGSQMPLGRELVSYETVVALAGERGTPTVTFYKAEQHRDHGTMFPGCAPVHVKDGTVFNVVHTGAA